MKIEELKPSPKIQTQLDEITAAPGAAAETSDALDRIAAERAFAQQDADALTTQRAALLAERAKQTDAAKIRAYEPQLKKISEAAIAASLNLESANIAYEALEAEHAVHESAIEELKQRGVAGQASAAYAQDVANALGRRVHEVINTHLMPLVLEAAALREGTNSAAIGTWLNELVLPKCGSPGHLFAGGTVCDANSGHRPLSQVWRESRELVALSDAASQVRKAVASVSSYIPRKQRMTKVEPYVRRSYTTSGVTGEKAASARAQLEATATPKVAQNPLSARATHQGSSEPPPRDRVPTEGNMGRHVLDDPDFAEFR